MHDRSAMASAPADARKKKVRNPPPPEVARGPCVFRLVQLGMEISAFEEDDMGP